MNATSSLKPDLREAAVSYAGKGLPVFPCHPDTKRPYVEGGFHSASCDQGIVGAWWDRWPNAMIGMPTGGATGFWALDIDDPEAFEAACPVDLPATRRVDTGKGYHLYFRYDPTSPVTNHQRHARRGWPFPDLPGAETRGDGGYVIVPPSVHPSGRPYKWHDRSTVVEAPADLLSILRRPREAEGDYHQHKHQVDGTDSRYGLAALERECAAIRAAANGAQECALNEAALKIGGLVAGGELALATARAQLIAAGLAMPSYNSRDAWTSEKVVAKIERALADGANNPRSAPEDRNFRKRAFEGGAERASTYDPATGEFHTERTSSDGATRVWPKPVNLWARFQEPPLPKGLLPELIEQFALKQGAIMGADPAGLAMAALTVCAAAVPDSIEVQVKRNDPTWRESARLWTALVGPPSRKKTPIFKAAIAPLRVIDNALMREYMEKMAEYESFPAGERKTMPKPKQKRLMIADATIEAAQEVLRDSPEGVLSEQDELSGWFGAMDKYAPGKGAQADRAFWLKAFNGGTYNLNRVTRGATQIPNLSINLLGGIQPEPLRKLASESVDDGLVQRLIPVILRATEVGQDVPNDGVVIEYEKLVSRLNGMSPPDRDGIGSLAEFRNVQPVHFSAEAKAKREQLEREHLELVSALEIASPKLASHFGKYDGLFARLCLLWHCIENSRFTIPPKEIPGDVAERVSQFMADFIRPSAIAFYAGLLGMSAGHEDLVGLASLIVAKGLDEVKARDAQRSTQSFRSMTAEDFRLLCEKLEAFGWLQKVEPGPKSVTPRWLVNPQVHDLYREKAEAEAARRASARDVLRQALGNA